MNEIHIPQFWKANWVKIKVMVAGYLKTPDGLRKRQKKELESCKEKFNFTKRDFKCLV